MDSAARAPMKAPQKKTRRRCERGARIQTFFLGCIPLAKASRTPDCQPAVRWPTSAARGESCEKTANFRCAIFRRSPPGAPRAPRSGSRARRRSRGGRAGQGRLEDQAQKLCARCKALGAGKHSDVNGQSCDNARATSHRAIMQELERRAHAAPLELR